MEKIKCITFDKEAQNNLPKHIKDKMKADRKRAEAEQLNLHGVVGPKGTLVCDCGSTDLKDYNDGLSKTCNDCGTAIIAN